jgi:hypothetical protein
MRKELHQYYGGPKPKSYRLAHNHVLFNGFRRFWIPPQWIGHGWSKCPCGWRPDLGTHYARSDHVKSWMSSREAIRKNAAG